MTTTNPQHNKSLKGYHPDIAIHPGITLRETIESLSMSQKELAQRTDLTPKTINKIVQGEAPITPDTAVKLERVLGISSTFWNNLDRNYQETLAKIIAEEQLEKEVRIAKKFTCYNELVQAGYVPNISDWKERAKALLRFFAVDSLTIIPELSSIAFRRTTNDKVSRECVAAWLRCGELQVKDQVLPEFNREKLIGLLPQLKELTLLQPEDYGKQIRSLCASAGVAVVYTYYFKDTYINGATRWINQNPLIQLNLRFKYSDIFWFTLFHEIGHILLHGKTEEFIEFSLKQNKPEKEKEADEFASNKLIPNKEYEIFISEPITLPTIKSFANDLKVDESIIVGRLAHDNLISWPTASRLRTKLEFANAS